MQRIRIPREGISLGAEPYISQAAFRRSAAAVVEVQFTLGRANSSQDLPRTIAQLPMV